MPLEPPETGHGKLLAAAGESPDAMVESLEREIRDTLADAGESTQQNLSQKIARVAVQRMEGYAGPLPHPEHFAHYEETLPGAADRILRMAEKEQDHRHAWERTEIRWEMGLAAAGQLVVGLVALLIAGGIIYLALDGKEIAAASSAVVSTIVIALVKRKKLFTNGPSAPNAAEASLPTTKSAAKKPVVKRHGK